MPASSSSTAKNSGVLPSSESACALSVMVLSRLPNREHKKDSLPPMSVLPSSTASSPLPANVLKSDVSAIDSAISDAFFIIAFASGCSLLASRFAAICKRYVSPLLSEITSVTTGSPLVIVPVLSNATTVIFPVCSIAADVLNKIPFFAALPFPTIIATGVAKPSAHGQLITNTEIPRARAKPKSPLTKSQIIVVTAAIAITMGTNTPDTVSAIFAIGALVAAASLTIWIIFESVVSSPTCVARHFKKPLVFTVADVTPSPCALSTGMLSPVIDDSSTALSPSRITPSTAIFSPGRTTNVSPMTTSSTGIVCSAPFRITVAVSGARFIRLLSASVVRPLEMDSNSFPTVMSVTIIAALSK